jgi:chromosome segregation ATPase
LKKTYSDSENKIETLQQEINTQSILNTELSREKNTAEDQAAQFYLEKQEQEALVEQYMEETSQLKLTVETLQHNVQTLQQEQKSLNENLHHYKQNLSINEKENAQLCIKIENLKKEARNQEEIIQSLLEYEPLEIDNGKILTSLTSLQFVIKFIKNIF